MPRTPIPRTRNSPGHITCTALLCVGGITTSARAQGPITVAEHLYIDFSRLPGSTPGAPPLSENTLIDSQFSAPWGITFSLVDSNGVPIAGSPIVVSRGGAVPVAVIGSAGNDAPLGPANDLNGLTDPVGPSNNYGAFSGIRAAIDPPARYFRIYMTNGDAASMPYTRVEWATGGDSTPGNSVFNSGAFRMLVRGTSNQPTTAFETRLRPNVSSQPYALTGLTAVRQPAQPLTGPFVRIAQESAPGLGDFDLNVLGVLRPRRSPSDLAPRAADVYQYSRGLSNNVSYAGLGWPVQVGQSTLMFADTEEGLAFFVVHNRMNEDAAAVPGSATTTVRLSGSNQSLSALVVDDPTSADASDQYALEGGTTFTAATNWGAPNSDGYALGGLSGEWSMLVSFQAFSGLSSWIAASSDESTVSMNLNVGRRVQFKSIPECLAVSSPRSVTTCSGVPVTLTVTPRTSSAGGAFSYAWRKNGVDIPASGPGGNPTALTPSLVITNIQSSDAASYDCRVSNSCGQVLSTPASVTVCPADFTCDGGVDGDDIIAFFGAWDVSAPLADLNTDGGVDGDDVILFFSRWDSNC